MRDAPAFFVFLVVVGGGYSIIDITPLELYVIELVYPRSMRACLRAASVI